MQSKEPLIVDTVPLSGWSVHFDMVHSFSAVQLLQPKVLDHPQNQLQFDKALLAALTKLSVSFFLLTNMLVIIVFHMFLISH